MGCISASVKLLNDGVVVRVADLTQRLSVRCGIVCSLADVQYLEVSPMEVQWITSDDVIMYTVTSNVDWEVIGGIEEEDYITTLTNAMLISNDTLLVNHSEDIIVMFANGNKINNETIIKNRYEA